MPGPEDSAFASGILTGAGLREISQTLGLNKNKKDQRAAGMGSAATQMAGNMSDVDRLVLLMRMQNPGLTPSAGPGPGPVGGIPPGAVPPAPLPVGGAPPPPPGLAAPLAGPPPGPGPATPGGTPLSQVLAAQQGGGGLQQQLPMQLLQQLLQGSQGLI